MNRFVEASTRTRRITWFTLIGLILVPLAIAGTLLLGTAHPTERLNTVTAAVVNNDDGANIGGQQVPLGRQLAAELVKVGKSTAPDANSVTDTGNYDWTLTDDEDAAEGLASGRYAAVVTIPAEFSKAATSYAGDADKAVQATIDIETSDKSRLVDDSLSRQIVSSATSALNSTLATTYLENVYVGFNSLGDGIGEAADGAHKLADGNQKYADGISEFADGTAALADGADQLADGTTQLADGAQQLADGAAQTVDGAEQLQDGVSGVADGTEAFADQLGQLAGGVGIAGDAASDVSTGVATTLGSLQAFSPALQAALVTCNTDPSSCAAAVGQAAAALPSEETLTALATSAATADIALNGSSILAPDEEPTTGLVDGSAAAADGAKELASGAKKLDDGFGQFVDGLTQFSDGVSQTADGASQLADGVSQTADGAGAIADGSETLATSAGTIADGSEDLADGLTTAADGIPSYDGSLVREQLATVATSPIKNTAAVVSPFNSSGVPLFFVLALWVGGLITYLVLQAVTARALSSTRSSLHLALQGYVPGLIVGVVQGLLVGVIGVFALGLDAGPAAGVIAMAALAGASFAAVNQGLAGLLGGVGRFIAMLAAVVTLAAGFVSTVPAAFDSIVSLLPLGAALDSLGAIVNGEGSAAAGIVALVLWLVFGLVLSIFGVARRRSVRFGTATVREPRTA